MIHRSQRAYHDADWTYLRVVVHDPQFHIAEDDRERANHATLRPERLQRMRDVWLAWNRSMPPIPGDASVSRG